MGVDSSDSVIAKASEQANIPANCSFQGADLLKLPFEDSTFDVVCTSQVLIHIPNAPAALREMRRVCKPGGFVAMRESDIPTVLLWPQHAGLLRWRDVLEAQLTASGAHPRAAIMLIKWALEAGFSSDRIEYSTDAIVYAGKQRHWAGEVHATRMMEDEVWRQNVVEKRITTLADFELMRDGFKALADDEAGVYSMPCGQAVCFK